MLSEIHVKVYLSPRLWKLIPWARKDRFPVRDMLSLGGRVSDAALKVGKAEIWQATAGWLFFSAALRGIRRIDDG